MDSASDRAFVARPVPAEVATRLSEIVRLDVWDGDRPPSASELADRCASATGVLTTSADRVDAAFLDRAPRLRVVSNLAVGYDNVDVAECTRRNIPLGNTPGVLTDATADLAMALVLAAGRRLFEARAAIDAGRWRTWDPAFMLGLELRGATIGVVGYGRIGRALAQRARAFGMEVLAWSRTAKSEPGVRFVELDELLEASDVVSLHVALSEATRHLIGARELALMKPSAILVNTARGAVVDQAALVETLRRGGIAAAGLDVFEVEPLSPDDPILALENCVALPHIGSATAVTRRAMLDLAVDNLIAGLRGEPLPACVNFPSAVGR